MNSTAQKLLVTSKSCANFFDSYGNWFDRKIETLSTKFNNIMDCLDDPSKITTLDPENKISIFLDDGVVSLSSICDNLETNSYSYIVNGVDKTDKLIDSVKSEMQSNLLYAKICKILANVTDSNSIVEQFCLQTQGTDLSESASNVRQFIIDIISDERLDNTGKLYHLIDGLAISESSTDGVSDIFHSDLFVATGTHPGILWAIETFDIDYSALVSKVTQVVVTAALSIGQIVKSAVEKIVSAIDWIKGKFQTVVVEGGQIFSINEYSFRHYDNTCDQFYYQFRMPTTDIGRSALANDLGLTIEQVNSVYSITENHPLIKIEVPFGSIYLGHYDGALGDTIIGRVYPKCVSSSDYSKLGAYTYNTGELTSVDDLVALWSGYNGSVDVNVAGSSSSQNKNFYDAFKNGRRMLNIYMFILAQKYAGNTISLSDCFTHSLDGVPADPSSYTNENVYRKFHHIAPNNGTDYTDGAAYTKDVYILNSGNVNSYIGTVVKGIITYSYIAQGDEGFAPYTVENNFYPSTFVLKDDENMVHTFSNILKTAGYAAIAIAAVVVTAKIIKNVRVKYQASEAAYWAAINNGDAVTAAKFARKSKFLAKFAGAGSVSTSAIGTVLPALSANDATIIRLIAGQ